jgi:hypothetical protein
MPHAMEIKGVEVNDELSFERSSYCANSCCLEVARESRTGKIYVRNSQSPGTRITFTAEEWRAFLAGVKSNEFDV